MEEIIEAVKAMAGNEYLYLPKPVSLIDEPMYAFVIWAVCVSPSDVLYVMDAAQEWHSVEKSHALVIERLKPVILNFKNNVYANSNSTHNASS